MLLLGPLDGGIEGEWIIANSPPPQTLGQAHLDWMTAVQRAVQWLRPLWRGPNFGLWARHDLVGSYWAAGALAALLAYLNPHARAHQLTRLPGRPRPAPGRSVAPPPCHGLG